MKEKKIFCDTLPLRSFLDLTSQKKLKIMNYYGFDCSPLDLIVEEEISDAERAFSFVLFIGWLHLLTSTIKIILISLHPEITNAMVLDTSDCCLLVAF